MVLTAFIMALNARVQPPGNWVLSTGIWNDSAYWNDSSIWTD